MLTVKQIAKQKKTALAKTKLVRWAEICRVLQLMGLMEHHPDKSSASLIEALRVNKLLTKRIDAGKIVRVSRGVYKQTGV